jgi:N6-L-threonylcarbamoyladenine synthase
MAILAVETSCDETAAAVVTHGGEIRSNVVASQAELHAAYGGVVPEIASRRHLELVSPVLREALGEAGVTLDEVDTVAVTAGPGLIGALLVGLATAKAIAFARRLPLIPVDHLHGHVASLYLAPDPLQPPFLCLLASGGHTILAEVDDRSGYRPIGRTLDDAAGEAFDKGARLLGLGYPGGAELERLAAAGDPDAFDFPVAMAGRDGFDFSFSGLKTALRLAAGPEPAASDRADLAAAYQRAIVRSLVSRTGAALEATGHDTLALVGGVAANGALREALGERCAALGVRYRAAPLALCSDNAAMIASAARFAPALPYPEYVGRDAYASVTG